ncbi:MAG: glycosyltransferase [Candidatus Margulisbacteria bacterium]|nr:glycosyltransferase [Candidatus Margulisiibacteriota bacterium]
MKILYLASKYDYGDPSRGLSFEHENFYKTLTQFKEHQLIYFDFLDIYQKQGRTKMNTLLWDKVREIKPDFLFCCLFQNEIDQQILKKISCETKTITYNWFCDDHFRFDKFSKFYAPCFDYVSTTDIDAISKYHNIGYKNVFLTQWACNTSSYKKIELPLVYDISFIGQPHGSRRQTINILNKSGLSVLTKGFGWQQLNILEKVAYKISKKVPSLILLGQPFLKKGNSTRISQEEMIKIFNQSKVNLNLSNASKISEDQIKGRNFEIPGCGGFLLTNHVKHLEKYYIPDQEIVCFNSLKELQEKITYYLTHEKERKAIAEAGYQRTIKEHTYLKRFTEIFNKTKQSPKWHN